MNHDLREQTIGFILGVFIVAMIWLITNIVLEENVKKETFETAFFVGAYSYHLRYDSDRDLTKEEFLKFVNESAKVNYESFKSLIK